MTLPASLTPPLSYVNRAPISMDDTGRGRAARADAPGAVDTVTGMAGRDAASLRRGSVSVGSQPGDTPLSGDRKPAVPVDTGSVDTGNDEARSSTTLENTALSLRRVLDIRARSETAELVELPVPVTEILRISLGGSSVEPLAAINAKSLYEGAQELFSGAAPYSSRQAAAPALRAA